MPLVGHGQAVEATKVFGDGKRDLFDSAERRRLSIAKG